MAHGANTAFVVHICFLVSSLWLISSLQKHSLTDRPRLSSILVLALTSCFTLVASFASKWLPGPGVKHGAIPGSEGQALSVFYKQNQYQVAIIAILIALRLEIFQRVMAEVQCSGKGIEAFLPMLLAAYEFINHQTTAATVQDDNGDPPEMWGSAWDDMVQWVKESSLIPLLRLVGSSGMISLGVLLSMEMLSDSTYFCSAVFDNARLVQLTQFAGVVLDAAVIILARDVLTKLDSTKIRLRAFGSILLGSAAVTTCLSLMAWFLSPAALSDHGHFRDITAIYVADIVSSGALACVVLVSLLLWTLESGPLLPVALATFLCGFTVCVQYTLLIGSYEQISPDQPVLVMALLFAGVTVLLFSMRQRYVARVHRFFVVVALFAVLAGCVTFSVLSRKPFGRHAVDELVYRKRIEADRWQRLATSSDSLRAAVAEYRERHHGREPPPGFDSWYRFATERKSAVVDSFAQIEKDVLPFWGMEPRQIHAGFEVLKGLPDVGVVVVRQGIASHSSAAAWQKAWLDAMVELISPFSEHLPDMSLAFNLGARPKILTPWEDIHRFTEAGRRQRTVIADRHQQRHARRVPPPALAPADDVNSSPMSDVTNALASHEQQQKQDGHDRNYITPKTFRRLQALACPPGSRTRKGLDQGVRDLCGSCAAPHSRGQFLSDWDRALDHCHQPDLFSLHEFYAVPHRTALFQDLLPLFSTSKTDSFNDVLVPHPGFAEVELAAAAKARNVTAAAEAGSHDKSFDEKLDMISWHGDLVLGGSHAQLQQEVLTPQALRGSHRNRLAHMVNNASSTDKVAFLVGYRPSSAGDGDDTRYFRYEDIATPSANGPLPFDVSFANEGGGCASEACRVLEREFGSSNAEEEAPQQKQQQLDPENHRYRIILDTHDGPADDHKPLFSSPSSSLSTPFLSALRSPSTVPILSSIFRTWHAERLTPWAHFIPLDTRYHALHSTVAYFVGLTGRGPLGGQMRGDGAMDARTDDAQWIAGEGSKWALRALRREDEQIYLFRLLLEWGRVVREERNELGFVLEATTEEGEV
ncbi:beta-1,2-xylosyltransferase [Microdochium nivale]|nr:beta-1,2-xylosyltransferase [Microdochium nivale]